MSNMLLTWLFSLGLFGVFVTMACGGSNFDERHMAYMIAVPCLGVLCFYFYSSWSLDPPAPLNVSVGQIWLFVPKRFSNLIISTPKHLGPAAMLLPRRFCVVCFLLIIRPIGV